MKKRLFAIMLALAMLLAAVPALAEEGKVEVEEQNQVQKKISCATEGCTNKVEGEGNLCATCAANAEGGTNGGSAGGNTGESSNIGNNGENTGNNAGNTGNNGGNTGSIGNAGTNVGQNPSTNGGGEGGATEGGTTGGEQKPCEHEWTYKDAPSSDSEHYCRMHKKTCSNPKCKEEVWESHEWDRANQEMVKESTCTEPGKDKLTCILCHHETYALRALEPHTKDDGKVIKRATCTEKGKIKYTCTECKSELPEEEIPALGHDYGDPTWNWCGVSSATATFKCKREGCNGRETLTANVTTSNEYGNCYVYTRYTAKVKGPDGNDYSDSKTANCRRPDWYYDPCYYNNPCGHWGCGDVCTRYSNCVPCRDYRTTFRVGGYNCLATPKTGDVSVIGMALISLAGAGAAIMGKKRK